MVAKAGVDGDNRWADAVDPASGAPS